MELLLVLLAIVGGLVLMFGDPPIWPYARSWRYRATGALTVILMIVGVLVFGQYIPKT